MSASNRYSSRVDLEYLASLATHGQTANKGDDIYRLTPSADSPAGRLGKHQLAALRDELSPRDLAVLRTLKKYRLAKIVHVQALVFHGHASASSARRTAARVLNRLHQLGLIDRLDRRIGGVRAGSAGHIYSLAPTGHRLLGETKRKRRHEPTLGFVDHTLAVTDLAARLTSHAVANDLELTIASEPDCWRSFAPEILKPDLHLTIANADTELSWFVEVDRGTESTSAITTKLQRYVRYWRTGTEQTQEGVFPKVAWIAVDQPRAEQLKRTVKQFGHQQQLFAVATDHRALDLLADFTEPQEGAK